MHLHWFRFITRHGVNDYYECRCGKRKARWAAKYLVGPIDEQWLAGGDWSSSGQPPRLVAEKDGWSVWAT